MKRPASAAEITGSGARGRAGGWVAGLISGVVMIAASPSALLAAVLLLPTVMALAADRQPGRPVTRAVLLFGLAACCQPMTMLWRSGHHLDGAWALATDLRLLAKAWAVQSFGWLLTQILPIMMGFASEGRNSVNVALLRRRQESIRSEWREADE